MSLETIRQEIDQVDKELILLLEKRMSLVEQIIEYKRKEQLPILDPKREQLLLEKVTNQVQRKSYKQPITAVFSDILQHSRTYQEQYLNKNTNN